MRDIAASITVLSGVLLFMVGILQSQYPRCEGPAAAGMLLSLVVIFCGLRIFYTNRKKDS